MNAVAILVIFLSHQGCWFGSDANQISISWAAQAPLPAADLRWELFVGEVSVASGRTAVAPDPGKTIVAITPPGVRVRTEMRWNYVLSEHDTGKELERGGKVIDVFPDSLHDGLASRIGKSRVVIWEKSAAIAGIFDLAKAPYTPSVDPIRIGLAHPDAVLVGADALDPSPFMQGPLLDLARGGASVMIFRQTRVESLAGYRLARRNIPAQFDWRTDHPLLRGFDEKMLNAIAMSAETDLAVRLPPDEPALAIAAWPHETREAVAVGTDALLVSKTIGRGRIVLCQLRLTNYEHDPRARMLLANAVDYLLTPPEPTPPPGERTTVRIVEHAPVSIITIPPGDR